MGPFLLFVRLEYMFKFICVEQFTLQIYNVCAGKQTDAIFSPSSVRFDFLQTESPKGFVQTTLIVTITSPSAP